MNKKTLSPNLNLSQSYQDAWNDYNRSMRSSVFLAWDYIILTASNKHQAEAFHLQIESRREYLPKKTKIGIIPDEGGVRVGSGGATLSALKWLDSQGGWKGKHVLVIHSGGDSKRIPQYSALGKLFSPVPRKLPDGRNSTLFDELMIMTSSFPSQIEEGMLILSGDVLPLFDPSIMKWEGKGCAAISFKEDVETGKNHGVYLNGDDGNVKRFLHKESVETLRKVGAIDENNCVNIDTGMILLGRDVLDSLWSLISTDGKIDDQKYKTFVNNKARLSLYGDFQYPLASDSTLEQFYKEKPEGEYTEELHNCRTAVWDVLHNYSLKLFSLSPAKFLHFGTTREVLDLMTDGVNKYRELNWNLIVGSCAKTPAYNSVIESGAAIGEKTYVEDSYIRKDSIVGDGCAISNIELYNEVIPSNVVLHGLKQTDGNYVCRIYGVNDNPKENKLFGHEIPNQLGKTLWNAPIYAEKATLREAVAASLKLYENVVSESWYKLEKGKSLAEGFGDADPEAIIKWSKRMEELVAVNKIYELIEEGKPATQGRLDSHLSEYQKEWLEQKLVDSDYSTEMRLNYYIGTALGNKGGGQYIVEAFKVLSNAILNEAKNDIKENKELRINNDLVDVKLPLRVNWGGGWSDTPPYCNEKGGTVLNAAITLYGEYPVNVRIEKIKENKIIFESKDMGVYGEFNGLEALQSVGDPSDPYVLQKAALLACGVIPSSGGDLKMILERIGGGFKMNSEVTNVPKGSGLGTSSILAATCVKAIYRFFGVEVSEEKLYKTVLCMEQIMSTGGGWQDQIGGMTDGIKFITSKPGLDQSLHVEHVKLKESVLQELNDRFCLIYTGQRRLARNILRDVVGRYIGNEPDTVFALSEIQKVASMMRSELEKGNVDEFALLLSKHWELSKMIDIESTNELIDNIFESIDDLIDGKMVCGAGGGGFLQVVLKKNIIKEELDKRLKDVFPGTEIGVWECELI